MDQAAGPRRPTPIEWQELRAGDVFTFKGTARRYAKQADGSIRRALPKVSGKAARRADKRARRLARGAKKEEAV